MVNMNENYFRDIGTYLQEIQSMDGIMQSWGYAPTIVPTIDSYEQYKLLDSANSSQSYKFLDANRDLLLLRSDSTLFLARMISKHINKTMLPLRLSYSNSVIRPTKTLGNNEIRQNGMELMGVASIAGDYEIILLTHTILKDIAPSGYCIHIGSRAFLTDALTHINPAYTKKDIHTIIQYIARRDTEKIAAMVNKSFATIILSIMEVQDFKANLPKLQSLIAPDNATLSPNALSQYQTLIESLSMIIDPQYIRCDFSEVGNYDYYTNIVFSVYVENQPIAVAHGGRYDALMNYFDIDIPAVGATLFPDVIMSHLLHKAQHETIPTKQPIHKNSFNALSEIATPTVQELFHCATAQIEGTQ